VSFLHTLAVTGPGGYNTDFTSISSNFVFTTEDPGGDGQASFDVIYYDTDTDAPALPPLGSQLLISDSVGPYWVGRVEEPVLDVLEIDGSIHGLKITITARGYGSAMDDIIYKATRTWAAGTPIRQIIIDALDEIGPPAVTTDPSLILGGGTTIPDISHDALGESCQAIINRYTAIGNNSGQRMTWGVRYYSGHPTFYAYTPPDASVFAYQVDSQDCVSTTIAWPLQWIRNGVVVKWSEGVWPQVDGTNRALLGISRDLFLDLSSTVGDIGTAQAIAGQVLNQFAPIRPFGKAIEIDYAYGAAGGHPNIIRDVAGNPIPPWRVRAGYNIKINNLASGQAALPLEALFVKSTHWDETARKLTIQTEQRESLGQIIGRVTQTPNQPPTNQPTSVNPIALTPGVSPNGPTDNSTGGGGKFVQADKTGKVNSGDMPKGWDLVSLNFVMNGGGAPITVGQKGWIGVDMNCVIERIIITASANDAVAGPATNCNFSVKLWFNANMETTNLVVPGTAFTQLDGTTQVFSVASGTKALFPLKSAHFTGDSLWGIEVVDSATSGALDPTAFIADVWLTGRRTDTDAVNISPDAPAITVVALGGKTTNTATITWKTDEASTSQVTYGPDANYGSWVPLDGTVVFDSGTPSHQLHSMTISGLEPGTHYYAKVISIDGTGRESSDVIDWVQ